MVNFIQEDILLFKLNGATVMRMPAYLINIAVSQIGKSVLCLNILNICRITVFCVTSKDSTDLSIHGEIKSQLSSRILKKL